ncbi:ATP-binding cassette domain-containing protein [uncultured Ruminococcus sp.]|uniref:ABC transporter ATP-binding protein n=1 Tax=uncultured Ruminococcus sp. TaxID=165186 RepID=UPI002931975B|nr:ATP-binding cassette domain-containing protein [uncultured Ruminococcus sp.]
MALVTVKNLSYTYPDPNGRGGACSSRIVSDAGSGRSDDRHRALSDINLSIERGEFITLMGATGSGKSTLLRLFKPELRQNGELEGTLTYAVKTDEGDRDVALDEEIIHPRVVGYVAQDPEEQIVTDKVWHELAFTLENLGMRQQDIARRVAEIASYFGIDRWMERDTATLSGGEKQLLNLAAVMIADPELLLLDEPTAQLDPIAATRFIETVYRLNRETGVTVLLCEHRCEELFPLSDRIVILDGGRVVFDDTPRKVAQMIGKDDQYSAFLPTAARLYHALDGRGELPLSVREGQRFVEHLTKKEPASDYAEPTVTEEALTLKNIRFRYERRGADILHDLDLTVYRGEVFALLGANGAGKSTAAAVAAGLRKPYAGTVKLFGKPLKDYKNGTLYRENLSLLPQDAESVFLHETVGEELWGCDEVLKGLPFDLSPLYERHPYDISGGERQLVALAKSLSTKPRFLIMDEPSKGLDANRKALLLEVIRRLQKDGVTILLITHDVEFAALCADRCALFAQGRIAAVDRTDRFMTDNRFYTTAASRITRRFVDGAYTVALAAKGFSTDGGAV